MWFEKACRCLIVASQILHLKYSGVVCIRITCVLATDIAQRIFPQRVHSNLPSSLKNTISGRNSSTYWTSKPKNSGIFNSLQCFISLMISILTGNKVSKKFQKKTLIKHLMCKTVSLKIFFKTSLDGEAIRMFQNFMYWVWLSLVKKEGNYFKGEYYSREDIEYYLRKYSMYLVLS